MYQQILTKQWNDLVDDFITENKNAPQKKLGAYSEWYRVNVHRFKSISAVESMSLDQLGRDIFAKELRAKMDRFEFTKPAEQPTADPRKSIILAAVAGVASILLLPLLPFAWTKGLLIRILIGLVVFIAVAAMQIKKVAVAQDKEQERIFYEYADQLKTYLPELIAVCKEYGVA